MSLRGEYCINGDSVALQALPGGGTFSGDGVNGNYFNPAAASTNAPTISYNYTDGAGCDATLNAVLTIHDTLPISIDNLDTAYCVNEPLVVLSGFPFGGVFSGNGVVGNVFSPDTAGNGGPYLITYTHTDANGCVTSTSADTRIKPAANLLINGLAPEYCIEDDREVPIVLAPSGGTLLGSGITGTSFNPSNAGLGDYVISYEYTNSEGCTSYTWYTVNVRVCTGVDEVDANIQIGLYPNPTTGLLHFAVEGLDGQQVDVAVFSLQGQRILSQQFENVGGGNAMQLDLNGYATGTYLVQVQAGDYSSVHRVVVSR